MLQQFHFLLCTEGCGQKGFDSCFPVWTNSEMREGFCIVAPQSQTTAFMRIYESFSLISDILSPEPRPMLGNASMSRLPTSGQ